MEENLDIQMNQSQKRSVARTNMDNNQCCFSSSESAKKQKCTECGSECCITALVRLVFVKYIWSSLSLAPVIRVNVITFNYRWGCKKLHIKALPNKTELKPRIWLVPFGECVFFVLDKVF